MASRAFVYAWRQAVPSLVYASTVLMKSHAKGLQGFVNVIVRCGYIRQVILPARATIFTHHREIIGTDSGIRQGRRKSVKLTDVRTSSGRGRCSSQSDVTQER